MTRVTGHFREVEKRVALIIPLETKEFNTLKKHIANNMFFAYRRTSSAYGSIMLTSIGDHLDGSDRQDLDQAEVYLYVDIDPPPSREMIYNLERLESWVVGATNEGRLLMFSIEKDTQYIQKREYTDAG